MADRPGHHRRSPAPLRWRPLRWVAAAFFFCLGTPGRVWALCPNCLGQQATLTPTMELIGLFLLLPFLVAYVAVRAMRRACRALPADASGPPPPAAPPH